LVLGTSGGAEAVEVVVVVAALSVVVAAAWVELVDAVVCDDDVAGVLVA
jgi:hypothetical protein